MIKPLRSRHRWMIILLSIIIPLLFVAGLLVRQPNPPDNTSVPVPQETPGLSN